MERLYECTTSSNSSVGYLCLENTWATNRESKNIFKCEAGHIASCRKRHRIKHPSKSKATTRFKDIDISSNRSLCLQHYNVLKPNTSFMLKPLKTNYRAILHFTYVP